MRIYENGKCRDMTEEEITKHKHRNEEELRFIEEQEIASAKLELAEEDYKIIKCMEYYLAGKELPYDINKLHKEREKKREKADKKKHN